MADHDVKAMTAQIDCPAVPATAFTRLTKPLAECMVAVVTTAALHHPDQPDFTGSDTSFRVLRSDRRDWMMGHWSPNFDASAYAADVNVVMPLDRLDELVASGRIAAVSPIHLSYAGNQFDLTAIQMDGAPAGAKLLRDSGVDIAILTPV